MKYILNIDDLSIMFKDALRDFNAERGAPPFQAVLWIEIEHEHCGLYISTDEACPEKNPAEFDFPNYRIFDILFLDGYQEKTMDIQLEVIDKIKSEVKIINQSALPKVLGVQVDYAHYTKWFVQ